MAEHPLSPVPSSRPCANHAVCGNAVWKPGGNFFCIECTRRQWRILTIASAGPCDPNDPSDVIHMCCVCNASSVDTAMVTFPQCKHKACIECFKRIMGCVCCHDRFVTSSCAQEWGCPPPHECPMYPETCDCTPSLPCHKLENKWKADYPADHFLWCAGRIDEMRAYFREGNAQGSWKCPMCRTVYAPQKNQACMCHAVAVDEFSPAEAAAV